MTPKCDKLGWINLLANLSRTYMRNETNARKNKRKRTPDLCTPIYKVSKGELPKFEEDGGKN